MNKLLIYWRTMIVILILAALTFVGMIICLKTDRGVAMFPVYCAAMGAFGTLAVTKSGIEHVTNAKAGAVSPLSEAPKEQPHG